jgi:hypothetical protein
VVKEFMETLSGEEAHFYGIHRKVATQIAPQELQVWQQLSLEVMEIA